MTCSNPAHHHDAVVGLVSLTASSCAVCDLAAAQGVGQYAAAPAATATEPALDTPAPALNGWAGVIGMEDTPTGDGRLIERNALRWDADPLPFRYVAEDNGYHDGAEVVGRILGIERRPGGVIWGWGDFDLSSDAGLEAQRQVNENITNGVSMDLDDVSFEVRIAADVLNDMQAAGDDEGEGVAPDLPAPDDDGMVTVVTINAADELSVTTSARIRAATLLAIPAFAEARVAGAAVDTSTAAAVDPEQEVGTDAEADTEVETVGALVASGAPSAPPFAWFSNPNLAAPTPLTITADGRVYGHIAMWGTCHTGHAQRGECITPPSSRSGYSHFLTGSLLTAEGDEVPVGHITIDTRHAADVLTAASAAVHYDNTGSVVADVMAGEDAHGIWFAGALRPGLSASALRAFRAAPLSGDWRTVGGNLELVAVLGVNMPGFPVPRPRGLVASGRLVSLVASGMVAADPGGESVAAFSPEDVVYLRRLAGDMRAAEDRTKIAQALAARMGKAETARKVAAYARTRKG